MESYGRYDALLKLLLVGCSGVGKSCFMTRYCDEIHEIKYISTIGIDFKIKKIQIDNKIYKLQIWDTAGQERFNAITLSYYRSADCVFVMYDISDRQSFDCLDKYISNIDTNCDKDIQLVVVGNKSDCHREVTSDKGLKFANKNKAMFFETSVKLDSDDCIAKIFEDTVRSFIFRNKSSDNNKNNDMVDIREPLLKSENCKCKC